MGAYMVVLCFGATLDNWAHFHGKVDESFFTPWHAVLYGMMALVGVFLGATALINLRRGFTWTRSLPPGYMLSLLGVGLFILSGLMDLGWHLIFGIEFYTAAYVSPTHLFLLGSAVLAGTGPVRSAWLVLQPATARGWITLGPMLLSAASAIAALAMFTQFASPLIDTFAAQNTPALSMADPSDLGGIEQSFGVATVIIQTVLLMSFILLLLKTWRLPFGTVALLITVPSTVQALMADNYWFIPAVFAVGLVSDVIVRALRPPLQGKHLYAVASLVPALYLISIFTVLGLTVGIHWPTTLVAGSVVYAAATGLLLAFLLDWPIRYQASVL
jgi:hypothetical protein